MSKEFRFALWGGIICIAAVILVLSPGCTTMPNGGIPIYVRIDSPTLVIDDPHTFGAGSFKIPDVWAQSGSQDLGAYEMPVNIPVLAQGDVRMLVSAGIYDNGISNTRAAYPFYRSDTFTISNAIPGHVYHHKPIYHYIAGTQVGTLINFENRTNDFTKVIPISNPDPASIPYQEQKIGQYIMSVTDSIDTIMQIAPMIITTNGREAYLEFDYKSSRIYVEPCIRAIKTDNLGNVVEQNDYGNFIIKPSEKWNRAYMNFNNEAGYNQGAKFQIFFVAKRVPITTDTLFIDNVKFLYFH